MTAARVLVVLATALGTLLSSGAAAQQPAEIVVRGRIIGPDNTTVRDQQVVLHRVMDSGGATVAEATTSAQGEFELRAPAEPDTAAIYFVASRYQGELYIGPAFRAGQESLANLDIQVGVPGTSASALLGTGTSAPRAVGRPLTNRNWLLILIPLVGVAAVAVYALVPRGHVPEERAVLIRVAELDERMSAAPAAQRESLLDQRARLMARLRAD